MTGTVQVIDIYTCMVPVFLYINDRHCAILALYKTAQTADAVNSCSVHIMNIVHIMKWRMAQ